MNQLKMNELFCLAIIITVNGISIAFIIAIVIIISYHLG